MKKINISKVVDIVFIIIISMVIFGNVALYTLQGETLHYGITRKYYDKVNNIKNEFLKKEVKDIETLHSLIKDENIKKNLIVENEKIKYIGEDIKEIIDLRILGIDTKYNYNTPYIPKGFYYVGGEWDTGYVISDNKEDEGKGVEQFDNEELIGNQFVWIPISDMKNTYKQKAYDRFRGVYTLYSEFSKGNTSKSKEIQTSVYKHQGFYIARYEASIGSDNIRSVSHREPMNNVIYKEAEKYAADMYKNNEDIVSILPTGEMWDSILCNFNTYAKVVEEFINIDSSVYGNYSSGKMIKTGEVKKYGILNIYDMAGNLKEWTSESYSQERGVLRGGSYLEAGIKETISFRDGVENINSRKENIGFRVALYKK